MNDPKAQIVKFLIKLFRNGRRPKVNRSLSTWRNWSSILKHIFRSQNLTQEILGRRRRTRKRKNPLRQKISFIFLHKKTKWNNYLPIHNANFASLINLHRSQGRELIISVIIYLLYNFITLRITLRKVPVVIASVRTQNKTEQNTNFWPI